MKWYALPLVIFAGISIYVGSYHLWMFIKRRQEKENLSFSVLTFTMGVYYLIAAQTYNSPTVEESTFWYRNMYLAFPVFVATWMFFIYDLTEKKINKVPYIFAALHGVFAVAMWFAPSEYTFSTEGAKPVIVESLGIQYNDPKMGTLVNIYFAFLMLEIAYTFIILLKAYRSGKKYLLLATSSITVFMACSISDLLVTSRVYDFMYLLEWGFMAIILNMAYTLLNKFVGLYETVETQSQHQMELNKAFRKFVPHEFISFLNKKNITEIALGDQVEKEMTILFSDIRSFTALSETMTAEQNFNFINSYLSRMGPVIRRNNGFIDKYIGDAIMALFPGKVDDALQAAIEMRIALQEYNEHRKSQGYPAIDIGIGIHTGTIMLGTVGETERMEGTVISDAVNLTSRLEGATKTMHVPVIISKECVEKIQNVDRFFIRSIGSIKIKGKSQAVPLYELFNGDEAKIRDYKLQTKEVFEKAIALLHSGERDKGKFMLKEICNDVCIDSVVRMYLEKIG